ncbi:MAG: glycosyltransferase family 2 protein [bacterium]|nr:glycosyltransferase family 2 protein [bacterium]
MNPHLSVIIPAYKEEKRLSKSFTMFVDYLSAQPFEWELIIVVDGSPDKTGEVAKKLAQNNPSVRVIDRKDNHGKGYTVREGLLAANGDIRLFADADNSTDINHFDKMKSLFENGADVVICSRDAKDAAGASQAVKQPILKRTLGNLGNLYIQIMAVWGIWDTQCGFKAFSAKAAEDIFSVSKIDRWGFDVETLALARHFKYKIEIVPAYWINDTASTVTLSGYLKVLWETLLVRWWLLTGGYKK